MKLLHSGFWYSSADGQRRSVSIKSAFEVEELCQETFAELYTQIEKGNYDFARPAKPYVLRIAINRALRHLGRAHREQPMPAVEDVEAIGEAPDDEERERVRWVREYVESLPEAERRVYALYYQEELEQTEIAARLDLSRDQVYRMIVKIRRGVAEYFARKGWFDDA